MLLYLELFYVVILFCAAIVRNKLLKIGKNPFTAEINRNVNLSCLL